MAIDLKYGKVATEHGSIPEDEPVFLLRGQDALAMFALEAYREATWTACCAVKFREDVNKAIKSFRDWPEKKLPN